MFTGLIEDIGTITGISRIGNGVELSIKSERFVDQVKNGDSISVNGVCLTIVDIKDNKLFFQAVEETMKKTSMRQVKQNALVNLERALEVGERFGGHYVTGHVDCIGRISNIITRAESWLFEITIDEDFSDYIVPSGSIAIDGVSLTIASISSLKSINISIIPHTYHVTIFHTYHIGSEVNIEFDLFGKYIVEYLRKHTGKPRGITMDTLKNLGY